MIKNLFIYRSEDGVMYPGFLARLLLSVFFLYLMMLAGEIDITHIAASFKLSENFSKGICFLVLAILQEGTFLLHLWVKERYLTVGKLWKGLLILTAGAILPVFAILIVLSQAGLSPAPLKMEPVIPHQNIFSTIFIFSQAIYYISLGVYEYRFKYKIYVTNEARSDGSLISAKEISCMLFTEDLIIIRSRLGQFYQLNSEKQTAAAYVREMDPYYFYSENNFIINKRLVKTADEWKEVMQMLLEISHDRVNLAYKRLWE